jgi:hypothetical protein
MDRLIDIVLTEAKKEDIETGVYQNLLQQQASLEVVTEIFASDTSSTSTSTISGYVGSSDHNSSSTGTSSSVGGKKRRIEDIYNRLSTITTCGIVTTGRLWALTKAMARSHIEAEHIQ